MPKAANDLRGQKLAYGVSQVDGLQFDCESRGKEHVPLRFGIELALSASTAVPRLQHAIANTGLIVCHCSPDSVDFDQSDFPVIVFSIAHLIE